MRPRLKGHSLLPAWLRRPARQAAANIAFSLVVPAQRRPRPTDDVLVFKPDRIGDMVLAQGTITALRTRFGDRLVVVTSEAGKEVCDIIQPGLRTIVVPAFSESFRAGWRKGHPEAFSLVFGRVWSSVIVLRHQLTPWQAFLLSRIRTAKYIAATKSLIDAHPWEVRHWRSLFSRATWVRGKMKAGAGDCQEFYRHRAVLQEVIERPVTVNDVRPVIPTLVDERLHEIVVAPLASVRFRDIPSNILASICSRLAETGDAKFVWPVPQSDFHRAAEVVSALPEDVQRRTELRRSNSIADLFHQISRARMVIAAESGPAHIAVAMDKLALILIGGGHYNEFGPWSRSGRQRWISNRLECFNCDWTCSRQRKIECITGIEMENAAQIAHELWTGMT